MIVNLDNLHSGRRPNAVARVIDLDETQFDSFLPSTHAGLRGRIAIALFWGAVAALIGARVLLFDPSATRAVGSFPSQTGSVFHMR